MSVNNYEFLGGVVLADANGEPYPAGTVVQGMSGVTILGSVVLLDPETKEPYVIGDGNG